MRVRVLLAYAALFPATLSARANSLYPPAATAGGSFAAPGLLKQADVRNLVGLGGSRGNGSAIYPTAATLSGGKGFAFLNATDGESFTADVFNNSEHTSASISDEDAIPEAGLSFLGLSAAAPEPSGILLIGTGLVTAALLLRRRPAGRKFAMRGLRNHPPA